jgi:hypothetical protein
MNPECAGALIGPVVAVTGFAMGFAMSVRTLAEFSLTVGAGRFGGVLAARRGRKQDRGHPATR